MDDSFNAEYAKWIADNAWTGPAPLVGPKLWAAGVKAQKGDGYGLCVYEYAWRWASLMETALAAGETLSACADRCSHEADHSLGRWGITGFQYGCAVSVLAKCWHHGDELRRWHNTATQIGDEGTRANETGGVLNPALLCVGGAS
jgi:hypothetical protein